MGQKGRKEADPVYWITKERNEGGKFGLLNQKGEGRRKIQSFGPERKEEGRSSLLELEGRTEADPLFLTKKGRKEKYILLDLDDLIEMYKGGKASV